MAVSENQKLTCVVCGKSKKGNGECISAWVDFTASMQRLFDAARVWIYEGNAIHWRCGDRLAKKLAQLAAVCERLNGEPDTPWVTRKA